jgi:hypothetical protein
MIFPRRVISSSDDKFFLAAAGLLKISAEDLFLKLAELPTGNETKVINYLIKKSKEGTNFSYVVWQDGTIVARIVCSF